MVSTSRADMVLDTVGKPACDVDTGATSGGSWGVDMRVCRGNLSPLLHGFLQTWNGGSVRPHG